ncbi:hypothetical protein GP486_005506, partial [Trichoglossum hirsutum]
MPSADGTTASQVIAAVMVHDEVIAEGHSSSGRYAKLRASTNALELLKGLAPFEYRAKFGCDCAEERGDEEEDE